MLPQRVPSDLLTHVQEMAHAGSLSRSNHADTRQSRESSDHTGTLYECDALWEQCGCADHVRMSENFLRLDRCPPEGKHVAGVRLLR